MKPRALLRRLPAYLKRHQLLFALLALAVIAASPHLTLPASILPLGDDAAEEALRTTSPLGDPLDVYRQYEATMTSLFDEREKILSSPSQWKCDAETLEEMSPEAPTLEGVAKKLKAFEGKDITFGSFIPVVLEYQREYEFVLTLLARDARRIVYDLGADVYPPKRAKTLVEHHRVNDYIRRLAQDRERSRLAVERALLTLRSFELASPFTVEMFCLQRETADLRIAMSLLSDATSCMPKSWNPSTSLHDRYGE